MKLRKEIEAQIDIAEKRYKSILKTIVDYADYVYEYGDEDEKEYNKIVKYLTELTGKDIANSNYTFVEYWEGEGEFRESFKIALPNPVVVDNISKEELTEIVRRKKNIKIPDYLNTDFIKKNGFEYDICDYYLEFLKLNFGKNVYKFFDRQKDDKGNWYELSVEEIVEKILEKK